jgi:hypothetical protein
MACVALNIPRAIRLIRLFNILFFSLLPVDTRCVERLKWRYHALFSPKTKRPAHEKIVSGLFIILLGHGG